MSKINVRPPYYLDNDEIKAFRTGNFEIHCLSMILVRLEYNPKKIIGSGFIRQKLNSNKFEFVLYSKKTTSAAEVFDEFIGDDSLSPGQIIPKSHYYSLTCIDDKGRKWQSKRILKPGVRASSKGTLVFGKFDEIYFNSRLPYTSKKIYVSLEFLGEYEIPFNTSTHIDKTIGGKQAGGSSSRNVLQFSYKKIDFLIRNEDQHLQVELSSEKKKIPKNLEIKISEALQFTLGHAMSWSKLTRTYGKSSQITLRTNLQRSSKGIDPPIQGNIGNHDNFINLFSSYMNYVSLSKDNNYHLISSQIRSVALANSVNLETLSLTLSIAVESILQYVSIKPSLSKDELILLNEAKLYFSKWEKSASLSKRINGFLNALGNNTSTKDIFIELIKINATTNRHVKAWESLRNKLAHGGRIGSMPLQEFLNLKDTVLVLFYHLALYIIGYKGKYVDYSLKGWPESDYPLDDKYF